MTIFIRLNKILIMVTFTMLLFPSVSRCWRWSGYRKVPVVISAKYASSLQSTPNQTPLEGRLLSHWRSMNIHPKATILLSVSGGSDSIAMLYLMQSLKEKHLHDLDLKVVCYNHKVRPASEEEAQFVESIASKYGFDVFHRSWPEELDIRSNFQDKARAWRRKESLSILEKIRNPHGCFVSTAHHRDDQLETIVMKLLRGTFISNIRGMISNDGTFIKPLLPFCKDELVKYLQDRSLEWREDLSNQSRDYKRNKIRLDLIPILSDICGGAAALENRLLALVEQSSYIQPILDAQVAHENEDVEYRKYWEGYYTLLFKSDPKRVSKLVLIEMIHSWVQDKCGISLSYGKLQNIVKLFDLLGSRRSVKTTISKRWDICLVGRELRLIDKLQAYSMNSCSTSLQFPGLDMTIKHPPFLSFEKQDLGEGYRKVSFPVRSDAKCINFDMRIPDNGEVLPSKYGAGPKINVLALNHGVPTHERDRIMLLTNEGHSVSAIFPDAVLLSSQYVQKMQDGLDSKWISIYFKSVHADSTPMPSSMQSELVVT